MLEGWLENEHVSILPLLCGPVLTRAYQGSESSHLALPLDAQYSGLLYLDAGYEYLPVTDTEQVLICKRPSGTGRCQLLGLSPDYWAFTK